MIILPDIINSVVESMRLSGESAFVSGQATADNDFTVGEWIIVNGEKYKISAATDTTFTVDTNIKALADATYSWSQQAPYFAPGSKIEIQRWLDDRNAGIELPQQKYPLIVLQTPFQTRPYAVGSGFARSTESADDVSILFIQQSKADGSYTDRIDGIIKPQLEPLVDEFKTKLRINPQVLYHTVEFQQQIPNFGVTTDQGKEGQVTGDIWEVVELRLNMTIKDECSN